MIKKKLAYLLFFLFLSYFPLSPFHSFLTPLSAQVIQYENQIIEKIDISVCNALEDSQALGIKARLKSREGDFFSQLTFDGDLKMLANDFDRIDPEVSSLEGKVYIVLKIWPKPRIRTICWEGNKRLETKCLVEELDVLTGSLFDRRAFNLAFHKIKAYYVKKGFFEAQLEYTVAIDPLSNEADIKICINEGRAGRIKDIVFVNFTKEEQDCLLEQMVTKKYKFIISFFTDEGTYQEEAVQHDEFIILNYLQNKGYADAQVSIKVCEIPKADRIVLYITVDRGQRYYFGDLTVEGNSLFCTEEIMERFQIKKGLPYSPEQLRETAEMISDLYGRKGYIDAQPIYEPSLSEEGCVYSVNFKIEEGDQYRVGLLKVFGNCSTQTRIILHESLIIPGEIFNIIKLKGTENRLLNIGYFKNVNVYAVKSEEGCSLGGNYRDVHIEVEETGTGQFGAFVGFSTSEDLFAGINLTENNFNILGIGSINSQGLRSLRGNGEYLYLATTIGQKARSYTLAWSKPHFYDTPWTVGFNLENTDNRYISEDYNILSTSLRVFGMYRLNGYVRTGCHYRIKHTMSTIHESIHLHNDQPVDLEDSTLAGSVSDEIEDNYEFITTKNHAIISAIGNSIIYDSTNDLARPTKGLRSRLETEFAGIGGDISFFSTGYYHNYFLSFPTIDSWGVWKFRAEARFIVPVGNTSQSEIPLDERYFLGGECSVRGYRPYRLGPLIHHDVQDPKGGISLQLLSLEYARILHSRVEGFVFFDAGHLSDKQWHVGRFSTSVGYGARIQLFGGMPPLTLGMGYPLNPQNRSQVKRFFLTVGGNF